jgi:hypothetical protein
MTELEMEEQVALIRRAQEETRKFVAEAHKLAAEATKMQRERAWLPVTGIATVAGAAAVVGGLVVNFLFHH